MSNAQIGKAAWVLTVIGAINWGLVGLGGLTGANWNVVGMLFGSLPEVEMLAYVLIGFSGVWLLLKHRG